MQIACWPNLMLFWKSLNPENVELNWERTVTCYMNNYTFTCSFNEYTKAKFEIKRLSIYFAAPGTPMSLEARISDRTCQINDDFSQKIISGKTVPVPDGYFDLFVVDFVRIDTLECEGFLPFGIQCLHYVACAILVFTPATKSCQVVHFRDRALSKNALT